MHLRVIEQTALRCPVGGQKGPPIPFLTLQPPVLVMRDELAGPWPSQQWLKGLTLLRNMPSDP